MTIHNKNEENVFINNENIMVYHFIVNENSWKARWSQDQVKAKLLEQFDSFCKRETGSPRGRLVDVDRAAGPPHAVIISGLG